ncbi:MAG: (2Fe-2S)-binding protein [Dehalococcoidia bacterium]|nr:MAG: (2Fe-2S)-binding protein [Dehalococcoidia bacterium]
MTEKKKNGSGGKTRRDFLKDAGLLVGGTAIGSTVLLAACAGETETVTNTVTRTQTVTTTATESKFVCPIDGTEFDTFAELQAHFEATHGTVAGVVTLNVNGDNHLLQVQPYWSLAFVLREKLGLPGTKIGCDRGECGTCTVVVDGKAVYACTMLVTDAVGKNILTVEGLSDGITLNSLQQSFYNRGASQCGYCTPGFLMAATALLSANPNPSRDDVRLALSGHLCSCGEIHNFIEAVLEA